MCSPEERVITAIVTTEHCHRGLITMQAALQRRKWVLYRNGDPGSWRDNGRGYTEEISHRENSIQSNARYMLHMHIISVLDAKMSLYSRLFVDKHNKVILLGNNRRNITQHSQRCQCVSRLYELLQNIDVEPLDKSGCASKKGWEHGQGGGGSDSVSTRRQLAVNKIIISSTQHCHVSS